MPRELGKAKRSDLTGHFPGEQAEYGSALARFLEGAGQLSPLQDGTYLDAVSGNGNGNGSSTEVGRNLTEVPTRSSDTEVAPAPGGNGQHSDNGSDTLFDSAFAQDEMFPEPAFETEPMQPEMLEPAGGVTSELEPVTFEPSSDTLHPDAEPQSLDSVPDLTSPELDSAEEEEEEEEDELEDTDILERTSALPTVKPYTDELPPKRDEAVDLAPATSSDTGMLIAEAFSTRPDGDWDEVDFDDDSDDDRITDKIRMGSRPSPDEDDLTSVHPDRPEADGEKITNKVQPRRDVDPRAQNPDAVVRDTVNFYNQTQSLHDKKKQAGFPTISPNVVNSAQPLGLSPEGEPSIAPDMFSEDESETDTLKPGFAPMAQDGPELNPAMELALAPELEASFDQDRQLAPVGSEDETRIVIPIELQAESGIEDADRRETDKFNEDDRRPPPPPQPEGTDKLDKQQIAAERADSGTEPQGLEPLADEKVASGKDTQRFYVAEILAKKESHTGDTTAELQPAQEGPPPVASSADTSADYAQDTEGKSREPRAAAGPEVLPIPSQVHTDFKLQRELSPSARIVPEIESESESEFESGFESGPEFEPSLLGGENDRERDGDDTVDDEADALSRDSEDRQDSEERRITEKVKRESEVRKSRDTDKPTPKQPARVESSRRHVVAASASSSRVKRITDSLSQRMKEERDETLRLIEQAEAVAVKLREASEQSRTDLIAISARRAAISHSYVPAEPQVGSRMGSDLDELPSGAISRPVSPAVETTRNEPGTISSRRAASRVPTSAIGEIISELERSARSQPISLTELLDQVSQRHEPTTGTNGHDKDEDDVDLLVAASARWREIVEDYEDHPEDYEDHPEDERADESSEQAHEQTHQTVHKRSRRHSARTDEFADTAYDEAPEPAPRPAAASSTLASDLDRLWEVLDSRRTATVVLPAAERTRVSPRKNEQWEGWTQEMLWPTLAGIAGVTFALGALFVWVLMKWAA